MTEVGMRPRSFSKAHYLHAGVHEETVAGDAAAQVAGQEDGGVGDLGGDGVSLERRAGLDGIEDGTEVLYGAGGGGLYGAGGDGVDADVLRPHFAGNVSA